MSVSEKVAYLRGLMEGLDIEKDQKEGKLFTAIIDALDEIASEIDFLNEDNDELHAYIEEIDEDLGDVEDWVYDEECDCCDDDCDCDCCDDDCIEVTCPACGEDICINFDDIDEDGQVECPCCGETLEFEIEEADDDDDEDDADEE